MSANTVRRTYLRPDEVDAGYQPLALPLTDEQIMERLGEVRRALAGDWSRYGLAHAAMRELVACMERLTRDLGYAHIYRDREDYAGC